MTKKILVNPLAFQLGGSKYVHERLSRLGYKVPVIPLGYKYAK